MLHHLSFGVTDLEPSSAFYDAVLSALGYERVWSGPKAIGYGRAGEGDRFAIKLYPKEARAPGLGFHLAFEAPSRAAVDQFYEAAVEHGGTGDAAPRLWPEYDERYYAAFVTDPDGHYLEAVTREPV